MAFGSVNQTTGARTQLAGLFDAGGGATALANLTDVQIASLADGNSLYYDSTAQKWVNVPSGTITDSVYNNIASILS